MHTIRLHRKPTATLQLVSSQVSNNMHHRLMLCVFNHSSTAWPPGTVPNAPSWFYARVADAAEPMRNRRRRPNGLFKTRTQAQAQAAPAALGEMARVYAAVVPGVWDASPRATPPTRTPPVTHASNVYYQTTGRDSALSKSMGPPSQY